MVAGTVEGKPTVLLVGVGDVTIRLGHLLATGATPVSLVLASRSLERATRFANLTKLAAHNLGVPARVEALELDVANISKTAEDLARLRPEIIFMGASLQAARAIMDLPAPLFRQLDEAQLGPWLPMHLTLAYELMQAARLADIDAAVVNAAYPDAVGPALKTVGLAPDIGIGNVGNIVPGLTIAIGELLASAPDELEVKVVAHHYFSHHVHRFGEANGIPYLIHVSDGDVRRDLDEAAVFALLATTLRRQGGRDGQQITATSAARTIWGLLHDQESALLHAPAPGGRVGGYPVRASSGQVRLDLPDEVSEAEAESRNIACQRLDGIEAIDPDGTVRFGPQQMGVMTEMLGYQCTSMHVRDCRLVATELAQRYDTFLAKHRIAIPE